MPGNWPGDSPDLNPIENAWNWMKYQLKNTQLLKHGGVEGRDQEAMDPEDGRQRLPEGPGGEHAQEAGRGD